MTQGNFYYVSTSNIGEMRRKMGFSQMKADYLLDYVNSSNPEAIQKVIDDVDVVLISSSAPVRLVRKRMATNSMTFRCSERLFKTRSRYLKAPIHWIRCFLTRKAHLLCISAATARDYNLLGFYKHRCYKWGYFTEVKSINPDVLWEEKQSNKLTHNRVSILWVGRLIRLKHPETAILALHRVKKAGYQFDFKIVGEGPEAQKIRALIDRLGMNDCVHLLGAKTTEEVRHYMEESEIFLFTSNRQEGWGAVLYESMSCACAVVANSEIGAVPFLIKDKINGMIYKKGSVDSLVDCLVTLLESEVYMKRLGLEAYKTISENWTPQKAAENLLTIIDSIQYGKDSPIKEGPCSVSK